MNNNTHKRHGAATDDAAGAILTAQGYVLFEKMRWRTPPHVVADIARRMGIKAFDLDACAEDAVHHADRYLTHEEDALKADWTDPAAARGCRIIAPNPPRLRYGFMNPPYGAARISKEARKAFPDDALVAFPGTEPFVRRAWEMSRRGMEVAVLLGAGMDQWLQRWCQRADEVWFGPRLHFINVAGVPQKSPPSSHIVLIFRPQVPDDGWAGGPRVTFGWNPAKE